MIASGRYAGAVGEDALELRVDLGPAAGAAPAATSDGVAGRVSGDLFRETAAGPLRHRVSFLTDPLAPPPGDAPLAALVATL